MQLLFLTSEKYKKNEKIIVFKKKPEEPRWWVSRQNKCQTTEHFSWAPS
jgi:hypothetical protein